MSNETNNIPVYAEPEGIDYIIIKVKENVINGDRGGNLYETTRRAWRAKLETAMPYRYVLSVVGGVVQEVYKVSRWYTSPEYAPRIEFEGQVAEFDIRNLFVGKMIPECYRQKGLASPFLYKKKDGTPVAESEPTVDHTAEEAAQAAAAKKAAEAEAKAKAEAEAKAKAEAEAKAKAEAEAKAKAEAEAKAKVKAAKVKNQYDTVADNVNLDESAVALCQKYGVEFSPLNTVYLCSNMIVAYMWNLVNPSKLVCDYTPPFFFSSKDHNTDDLHYKDGVCHSYVVPQPNEGETGYKHVYFFVNKVVRRTDDDNYKPDISTCWGALNNVSQQMRESFRFMPDQNEQAHKDSSIAVKLFIKFFPSDGINGAYFRDFIGAFYFWTHFNNKCCKTPSLYMYEYFNYIIDNAFNSPLWLKGGASLYLMEKVGADRNDISDEDLKVLVKLFDDHYNRASNANCRTVNLYAMALRNGRAWSNNKETLFYYILKREKSLVGKWGDSANKDFLHNAFDTILNAVRGGNSIIPAPVYKFLCDLFITYLPNFSKTQVITILEGFLKSNNIDADRSLVN